jgi:hypothetical protein
MRRSKYTIAFRKKYGENFVSTKQNISKVSGIPVKILDEVYDRGMAAWLKSHRPGVTQHQWAMARVYSFVMGGKTFFTTDLDLAEKL